MELVTVASAVDPAQSLGRLTREERKRIGRRLRALRVGRELEQRDCASDPALGLARRTIQAIETAAYDVRDTNIDRYAQFFGTSLLDLLLADAKKAPDPRLEHLHDEHIEVARGYMRAPRRVRAGIELLLSNHPLEEHLTRLLVTLAALTAERLAQVDAWLASDDETRRVLELVRDHLGDPSYLTLLLDGMRLLPVPRTTPAAPDQHHTTHKKRTAPTRRA